MYRSVKKQIWKVCVLVCLMMLFTAINSSECVYAGTNSYYEDTSAKQAYANMGIKVPFRVTKSDVTEIRMASTAKCGLTATVYDNRLQVVDRKEFLPDMAEYKMVDGAHVYNWQLSLKKGIDYDLEVVFGESTGYRIEIGPLVSKINKKSATITKGFKTTLKVTGESVKSWKSSNTKVATVSKGVVTGKGKGTAVITATLKSGKTLNSKITVKNNEYVRTKKTIKNSKLGQTTQVYKAYYSGNKIILKTCLINNWDAKYNELKNISITVKDSKGKLIGKYKCKRKDMKFSPFSTKSATFTIDKPKNKHADLRKAKVNIKMTFGYKDRKY